MTTIDQDQADERRVIGQLIDDALAAGYLISYYDDGDWPVRMSESKEAVMAELHSTGQAQIRFSTSDHKHVGIVLLVFGNSPWEVIADYTDNGPMNGLLLGANALADEIEAKA